MENYIIKPIQNTPINKLSGGRKLKYPFDKLNAGEQMEINTTDKQNISSAAYNYAKRKGITFQVVRTVTGLIIQRIN